MRQKRKRQRRPFSYHAHILGNGLPRMPCSLVDISDSGARLAVRLPENHSSEFFLLLSSDGAVRRWCKVAWRSETEVGVFFTPAPPKPPSSVQPAEADVCD